MLPFSREFCRTTVEHRDPARKWTTMTLPLLPLLICAVHALIFRTKVQPELQFSNVSSHVAALVAAPSKCVPPASILLSTANEYHAELRQLQFARVRSETCLMRRVLSVCFNVSDGLGACVPGPRVHPAEFRRSNYANLIWAKWLILADALTAARTALWLDADVLLLRNPWPVLSSKPLGIRYDIRYQAEMPPPLHSNLRGGVPEWHRGLSDACPHLALTFGVNGGQLLVHSAALARNMYLLRPRNLSNADLLDQDFANRLLVRGSYARCPLPATFASAYWRRAQPRIEPCAFVTVHANGAGGAQGKSAVMREWLVRTAHCNATSLQPGVGHRKDGSGESGVGSSEGGGSSPVLLSASSWTEQQDLEWVQRRYPDAPSGKAKVHATAWNQFNEMFQQFGNRSEV